MASYEFLTLAQFINSFAYPNVDDVFLVPFNTHFGILINCENTLISYLFT